MRVASCSRLFHVCLTRIHSEYKTKSYPCVLLHMRAVTGLNIHIAKCVAEGSGCAVGSKEGLDLEKN